MAFIMLHGHTTLELTRVVGQEIEVTQIFIPDS